MHQEQSRIQEALPSYLVTITSNVRESMRSAYDLVQKQYKHEIEKVKKEMEPYQKQVDFLNKELVPILALQQRLRQIKAQVNLRSTMKSSL